MDLISHEKGYQTNIKTLKLHQISSSHASQYPKYASTKGLNCKLTKKDVKSVIFQMISLSAATFWNVLETKNIKLMAGTTILQNIIFISLQKSWFLYHVIF